MISDNAKTFKSTSRKLTALFECPRVTKYFTSSNIKWSFILEKAPWWGGRMIKSVKRCLRKTLGNARLSYEELLTELIEVESILNSRPITYVSTEDCEEPVTPSHLMYGRRLLSLPIADNLEEKDKDWEQTVSDINRRQRHLQKLLDHYWRRWKNEYLLELRESHRQRNSMQSNKDSITPNDIVIVYDENRARGLWRLGRVMSVVHGKDGNIRGATVRVAEQGKKPTSIRRRLQKLYPIEIRSQNIQEASTTVDTTVEHQQKELVTVRRTQRTAAIKANENRRDLKMNEQL